MQTCETCAYRQDETCRRYPPKFSLFLVIYGMGWTNSKFPAVKSGWWCGEHKPKEQSA